MFFETQCRVLLNSPPTSSTVCKLSLPYAYPNCNQKPKQMPNSLYNVDKEKEYGSV